jgi:hypothetical protein
VKSCGLDVGMDMRGPATILIGAPRGLRGLPAVPGLPASEMTKPENGNQ